MTKLSEDKELSAFKTREHSICLVEVLCVVSLCYLFHNLARLLRNCLSENPRLALYSNRVIVIQISITGAICP